MKKILLLLLSLCFFISPVSAAELTYLGVEVYNVTQLSPSGTIANIDIRPYDEQYNPMHAINTNVRAWLNSSCGAVKVTIDSGRVIDAKESFDYVFFTPLVQQYYVLEFSETVTNFSCFQFGLRNSIGEDIYP